ncbi:MAG: VOC family protein, partial [Hyphomicrobiales bacterium]
MRHYDRHWTPVHMDFGVDDIEGAVMRARDAGAKVEADIESFPWGSLALLSDP